MHLPFRKVIGLMALNLLLITASFAQCGFESDYSNLFVASSFKRPDGEKILIKKVAHVDKSLCYAEAVNEMPDFFDYFKTNFSDDSLYQDLDLSKDSVSLNQAYRKIVNSDDELGGKLQEFALKTYGTMAKDTVLFDEIIDVAVKFFSIKEINEKGRYVGKVCVGINQIEATMDPRKPLLEAFAFSAIMYDLKNLSPNLMDEFEKEVRQLYNLKLGVDQEERLLRAQGAIFMAMKNNGRLGGILAAHYAEHQAHLPFVIRGQ